MARTVGVRRFVRCPHRAHAVPPELHKRAERSPLLFLLHLLLLLLLALLTSNFPLPRAIAAPADSSPQRPCSAWRSLLLDSLTDLILRLLRLLRLLLLAAWTHE
eukprot:9075121-Pyramimonas_sp.AAC.1